MAVRDRLEPLPVVGTALRVQQRYREDAADQFAASIGFFAFLSLFPLLLITVAVAGMVLAGDQQAQREVIGTALQAVPGLSAAFSGGEGGAAAGVDRLVDGIIERAGTIGVVGAVTLLLSGLRVVNAAMTATLRVFHVEVETTGVRTKLRQLVALVVLGLLALGGVAATAALGVAVRVDVSSAASVAASVGSVALSVLLDFLLFLTAYRILAAGRGPGFRRVWPGALFAALAWTGLKAFGATYVSSQVAKANELYGVFGGVIALLLLFYLAGRIYLYGAELSALLRDPGTELAGREEVATSTDAPAAVGADVAGAGAGGLGEVGAGTPAFPRDPRPEHALPVPTAGEASPVVSSETHRRLAAARQRERPRPDPRGALALLIALAAVGGLVRFFRPWEGDGS